MASPKKAPQEAVVQDFPPSRPGLKFFGVVALIVAAIALLVFHQQLLSAIGMG